MTTVTTITKNVLKRAWTDLEPKLLAWLITGFTASFLIAALAYVGVQIPAGLAGVIVLIVGTIAGYWKSSTTNIPAAPAMPIAPGTTSPSVPYATGTLTASAPLTAAGTVTPTVAGE